MEELTGKTPIFKRIDHAVFDRIDKFKQTPNYTGLHEFYNGMEEEQQKVFKAVVLTILLSLPIILLMILTWQNNSIRENLALRTSIVNQANAILGQNQGIRDVGPRILSSSPIDSDSMMKSRLSNLLSSAGIDLNKIEVKNFESSLISSQISRAEAKFAFKNVSIDELMNIFTAMIQREKFRIQNVAITRNAETNFLDGDFRAIHFSTVIAEGLED